MIFLKEKSIILKMKLLQVDLFIWMLQQDLHAVPSTQKYHVTVAADKNHENLHIV